MISIENLKKDFEYPDAHIVDYEGESIFVKQYLPVKEKYKMIEGIIFLLDFEDFSPLLQEILFDIDFVQYYTNIHFDREDKVDYFETYDILHLKGIIDLVLKAVPATEYEEITRLFLERVEETKRIKSSWDASLKRLLAETQEMNLGDFNEESLQQITSLLKNLTDQKHI